MYKRGLIELSIGTIVIIVLTISMLILGLVLVNSIFFSDSIHRQNCLEDHYLDNLDTNAQKNCFQLACQEINMDSTDTGSWYKTEIECDKNGVRVTIDWSRFEHPDCNYILERWQRMRECIIERGADY